MFSVVYWGGGVQFTRRVSQRARHVRGCSIRLTCAAFIEFVHGYPVARGSLGDFTFNYYVMPSRDVRGITTMQVPFSGFKKESD